MLQKNVSYKYGSSELSNHQKSWKKKIKNNSQKKKVFITIKPQKCFQ